jgi:MoaA/NifB/PqqE/SkfB family radical SAM enzyme
VAYDGRVFGARVTRPLRVVQGAARLGAALATGGGFPFSATFILTHRCNFECAYCNIPAAAGREMTTAEFCRAIDELRDAGLVRASFSGGEALLRRDALEIIKHARGVGLMTSLNSNAWLTERHLGELAESLDLLVVSLDGPEPVHDLVRRRRGSYARVIAVLEGARRRGLATATITVLTRENMHVIDDVLGLAEAHGFYAYFQPAYEDCFNYARGLDPVIDARLFADIAGRLAEARAAGRPVGASAGYVERLARGPVFGDCSKCSAGRFWGTVLPDGVVIPCHLQAESGAEFFNGLEVGFAAAFRRLRRPMTGPGCAISPYQETDLIFSLDRAAIAAALRRLVRA